MRLTVIALTTTLVAPAYAGSLDTPVQEAPLFTAERVVAPGRFYGSLAISSSQLDSSFSQDVQQPGYQTGNLDFRTGSGESGAIGYAYGSRLRVEGELFGFQSDTGLLTFPDATAPFDEAATTGDVKMTGAMLNGWYTFGSGKIRPFVGGGIGMVRVDLDTSFTLGNNNGISDSDTVFAWQVGFGAEVPVSDLLSLVASYRHVQADGLDLNDNEATPISADIEAQVVTLGIMVRF